MGKRELLIAAAFVVVVAIAYQITAPAPKDGEGFSLRRLFGEMRREMNSEVAKSEFIVAGSIPVSPAVEVVRLATGRSVPVAVEGEDRADIAYEMPVQSTGPDAAAAQAYAKRSRVDVDDLGTQLTFTNYFPPEATQTAMLTLKVPARLIVRIESGNRPKVRGVAGVRMGRMAGEVVLENIKGAVTGTHTNGDLFVTNAGSVDLILISSRVKLSGIERVTANTRGGEIEIRNSRGPLALTANSTRALVIGHAGPIDIDGFEGSQVRVDRPTQPVHIDVKRSAIEVTLAAPVPVTALTYESPLRLLVDGSPSFHLDAMTLDGRIEAGDFSLTPESNDRGARLIHDFGAKSPRVILRNSRGEIVIARAK